MNDKIPPMSMMYESERYLVVMYPWGLGVEKRGYEIVDKAVEGEVFLHGDLARGFELTIALWEANPPHVNEVEKTLRDYTGGGLLPMVAH